MRRSTEQVLETPVIVFPPWINRFYILDLTPEKSFVRWCVEQGISLFMVSWKSADESLAHVTLDDYVQRGQIEAIDQVRDLLEVEAVHAIGYCVAGTTLAATLAYLAATGEAAKVKSATFFTAQVDFADAGDLKLFLGDETMGLLDQVTKEKGYLDGRYMAATFNLLRGRDLIWNYVVNNYLLGEEPAPFDLLHWNSDVTNLPAGWHRDYLETLYKQNKLVEKGGIKVGERADRPHQHRDAGLHPGRPRGPYRAARKRVEDHALSGRAEALRARRVGAYRRRGQPAGGGQVSILDQRFRAGAGSLDEFVAGASETQGQLVARLAGVAEGARSGDQCRRQARGCRARGSSRRSRMRRGATSSRAESRIRTARSDERAALIELQRRASLALDEHREQLEANPDAIDLPAEQLALGQVQVAEQWRARSWDSPRSSPTRRGLSSTGCSSSPIAGGAGSAGRWSSRPSTRRAARA